ncbi:MAG: starch-binding protein [Bacilli bacterium]|nr:starch-binding protein [Bacilli bacterium]
MEKRRFLQGFSLFSLTILLASCGANNPVSSSSSLSPSSSSKEENSSSSPISVTEHSEKSSEEKTSEESKSSSREDSSKEESKSSSKEESSSSSISSSSYSGSSMEETEDIVILCAKNTGYNHIYAWVDAKNVLTSAWPGEEMEDYDENWYSYTFDDSVPEFNVIFNNGSGGQTPDLKGVVNGSGYYWYTKDEGFFFSMTMPDAGDKPAPVTEPRYIDGPSSYEGGVASAKDYKDFSFWNSYPASYWTTIDKYKGGRKDFRQESIYFAITSRFYNGDESNDAQCWSNKLNPPSDPAYRGDFKGLIERMDYIKAMGFTSIWITPIITNASGYDYHGYHGEDFASVDSRLTSDDASFQDVIKEAHKRDMKIILDVVFNHTGNFGDETLFPMFIKDKKANQDDINATMMINKNGPLYKKYPNYASLPAGAQYDARIDVMKGKEGDPDDIYHHYGQFSWETQGEQVAQIAGDCVDLNTENPRVAEYIVDSYGKFIRMGVDAFRIDTMKHINRLTLNKYFFPALREYASRCRGDDNFFMFGEVCARVTNLYNHDIPSLSPSFYTWKEEKEYAWGDKETNYASAEKHYHDYEDPSSDARTSNNCYLSGMNYHTPDLSSWSGNSVIDFRMHRSFDDVNKAYNDAVNDDKHFVDATYNVTYVDSHDYAPEPQDLIRPEYSEAGWADRLNLMFTFRGIPCLYYGTEVRLGAGNKIDNGNESPLSKTGRAYFGDYLEGKVTTSSFGSYSSIEGKMEETLNTELAKHIRLLNKIRLAVPALQMGQYKSFGNRAFVRRYTSGGIDSVVCVVMNGSATFSSLPSGTYVDLITGDSKTGTSFSASANGEGNLRVYVLNGTKIGGSMFAK